MLAWRDVAVRYKQTALGASWAVLQPVAATLVLSVFVGGLAKVPSNGVPYPLFAYCGLLPWQLFAAALTQAGNSLVSEQRLLTKVYFPRLLIPLSAVLSGVVDFVVALGPLAAMLVYYKVAISWRLAIVPCVMIFVVASALGAGLWIAALNVEYRDFRYTIPFLTQMWLFVTPVLYPSSVVPARYRDLYALNPMVGAVDAFRWAIVPGSMFPGPMMAVSGMAVAVLLVGGLYYFRRMEGTFADVV